MELKLVTVPGVQSAQQTLQVNAKVFADKYKPALIHQVVVAFQAAARAGTRAQKSRSEVRGGGIKPWKQKGTGRARAGSIRSPIWRGGGVTFAAKPQDHSQKVNKKMYRGAMCSILSELVRQDRLVVVEDILANSAKTKDFVKTLKQLQLQDDVLLVTSSVEPNLYLATRNLKNVAVIDSDGVDPLSLVGCEKVLFTVPALKKIEARLA